MNPPELRSSAATSCDDDDEVLYEQDRVTRPQAWDAKTWHVSSRNREGEGRCAHPLRYWRPRSCPRFTSRVSAALAGVAVGHAFNRRRWLHSHCA